MSQGWSGEAYGGLLTFVFLSDKIKFRIAKETNFVEIQFIKIIKKFTDSNLRTHGFEERFAMF